MAIAKTKLEYVDKDTGNWTQATTSENTDAVVMLTVDQNINAPAKADIIVSNRSPKPFSSDPAQAKGPLTDEFFEFQRIRLIHQEKGIPIFSGRIYRVRDKYDLQYGQTLRIEAFDSLKELREYPIDNTPSLESIDTTDSDESGFDLRRRSQVIKYMLNKVNLQDKNLLTTDANHFEDSWATDSLKDKTLNLTKLDRNVLGIIQDLALSDPINNQSAVAVGESGYDFRAEPRLVSSASNSMAKESLHYFMRGTRPGKGGAYGNSATPTLTATAPTDSATPPNPLPLITDSLTIEYGNEDSVANSGIKQSMMAQTEFDKPKEELYTSVVCHYTDEGREDASGNDESGGKKEGVVTFELLKGSALSGTFTWTNKALDPDKDGVVTNKPEFLNISGGTTEVARVQWQNTGKFYLMISHINEATFPTSGVITLVGADSGATFVFNAATGRMKTKYGVERPLRIQRNLTSDLGMIRDEVVSRIVGRSDLEIVRGKFQTTSYPIVYHDLVNTATPPASTASRSSNTITWTDSIAAKERGIRIGHVVAEINASGEYVRYAYISAVNTDRSITYGTSDTDTSDETALNSSNTIRLIIPLRAGDVVKVVHAMSNVSTDQVILGLGYDEFPGAISTRFTTVGSNNKFNNIFFEGEELRTAIAMAAPKKFPADKSLGETSFFFDGFINRGSNPSDVNDFQKIHWLAGTLTTGDGTKYSIAAASSANLTTAEHTIFFRPTKARATTTKSNTAFQVLLTTNYKKDPDDILVGWCYASGSPPGKPNSKAVLILQPQFMSKDLFAAGQNATLTEALLSKSAQEYSSGLEIVPVTSGFDGPPNTRHQQVTWAACTATSGPGSTDEQLTFGDGDVWSIAAKSGSNYSVTTNGSTFANITALAVSSTYFVFVDTSEVDAPGTLTLRFTTKYSHLSQTKASEGTAAHYSTRVILAQIAVPADGTKGAAPRVFPFNNRSLTVNAASIAADSITATHVAAASISTAHIDGRLGGGAITIDGSVDFSSSTFDPREKAKTFITADDSSPPTALSVGDLWITTDDQNIFRATAVGSGSWVVQNNKSTAFFQTTPTPTAIKQGDIWYNNSTNVVKIASGPGTGGWTLRDDAAAINQATTSINGGLIKTQRIKLLDGGSLNSAANGIETTLTDVVSTLRLINDSGDITTNTSTTTFSIDAFVSGDLRIYAGDIIQIDSEAMRVESGSDTSLTVKRAWLGTTAAVHGNNALISKYNYDVTASTNAHIIMDNAGITGYSDAFTPEFSLSSETGKGVFGGGLVIADSNGLTLTTTSAAIAGAKLLFAVGGSTEGFIGAASGTFIVASGDGSDLALGSAAGGGGGGSIEANTDTIIFSCKDFRFSHGDAASGPRYSWPQNTPSENQILKVGEAVNSVFPLSWAPDETTSTIRAKMDIQDIAFDTSKVYNLQAKSFRYRAQQRTEKGIALRDDNGLNLYTDTPEKGADSPLRVGMIAEEVYEHIPELVGLNTKANQPVTINYPLLSVVLLEEVKKLRARIEVLEGN